MFPLSLHTFLSVTCDPQSINHPHKCVSTLDRKCFFGIFGALSGVNTHSFRFPQEKSHMIDGSRTSALPRRLCDKPEALGWEAGEWDPQAQDVS